jgi:hypothetical protein
MSIHEPIYGLFWAHRVVVWSTQGPRRGRRCSTVLSHTPLNFIGLRRRGWRTCFLCVICGPHLALELLHLDAQDPAEPTTNGGSVRKVCISSLQQARIRFVVANSKCRLCCRSAPYGDTKSATVLRCKHRQHKTDDEVLFSSRDIRWKEHYLLISSIIFSHKKHYSNTIYLQLHYSFAMKITYPKSLEHIYLKWGCCTLLCNIIV